MRGKILNISDGTGIIVSENGDRYEFVESEIKSEHAQNGKTVDFVAEDGQAKAIYVIDSGASAAFKDVKNTIDPWIVQAKSVIDKQSGGSVVKKFGYLAAAGMLLSIIGAYVSDLLFFIGFGIELFALFKMAKIVSENSFFMYRIKANLSLFVALLLFESAISSAVMALMGHQASSIFLIIKILFIATLLVYSAITAYKALSTLTKIFKTKMFIYAVWAFIAGVISPLIALTGEIDLALRLPFILFSVHSLLMFVGYILLQDPLKAK
ncbi:MAG: hypothetical protein AB7E13_11380 [Arcobacteraceae bacterium]